MAGTFYTGNTPDTTSKDLLTGDLLVKTTKQEIDERIFEHSLFNIFTRTILDTGIQWEEIEVGNLTSDDFDASGANPLTKKEMNLASIYHKINRRKTFKATVSDAQIKMSMISPEKMAVLSNAIVNEIYNSSAIEDFEAMKTLLSDIAKENKVINIVDLNGNGENADAFTKAIQTLATNMGLPSTNYNFSGFKKAFTPETDLVLIIDSPTRAILNVDSLATAFNMDKKALVKNIIVIDEMPTIEYTSEKVDSVKTIDIGEQNDITIYRPNASGAGTVTGKVKAFLCDKRAIIRDPVERELESERNAKGRFTNYYYHVTDVLTYSTLKNAVALVD